MKMHTIFVITFLFIITHSAYAGWQVTQPAQAFPREPFFQAGPHTVKPFDVSSSIPIGVPAKERYTKAVFPNQFVAIGPPKPMYAVSLCGSLKENLERILGRYHWKVIWKAPYDYNFDGKITGRSLQNVVEKLLNPFPLQAIMYMSNRTVAIVPRFKA